MTKWKEELDKIIKLDEEGNTVFSLLDVQDFIEEIIEKLIDDIPDSEFLNENVMGEIDLTPLKQKLRDKYLN